VSSVPLHRSGEQDRAEAKAKAMAAKAAAAAGGGGSAGAAAKRRKGGAKRSRFQPQFGAAQVGGDRVGRGKAPPERGLQIHTRFDNDGDGDGGSGEVGSSATSHATEASAGGVADG
jgi:hypothetical protein